MKTEFPIFTNYILSFAVMGENNKITGTTIGALLFYFYYSDAEHFLIATAPEDSKTGSHCSHWSERRIGIKRHTWRLGQIKSIRATQTASLEVN